MNNSDQIVELPLIEDDEMSFPATEAIGEAASEFPQLNVGKGLVCADWISSNTKQDVVAVLDWSGSMAHLLSELDQAMTALHLILASAVNKNGFRMSVIGFSDDATLVVDGVMAKDVVLSPSRAIAGTNFDAALDKTCEVVTQLRNRPNPDGWSWLRPQVFFLSDGFDEADPAKVARVQEVSNVWSIAYGPGANVKELSRIASDGQAHVVGTNGGELRKFLANVGETLSAERLNAR